jgi:uncharacterized protein
LYVHHQQAVGALNQVWEDGGLLITTNLVLIELTGLLVRMRIDKIQQVEFFANIGLDPSIEVKSVVPDIELAAWELWKARLDKSWSMVDCASFVIMKEMTLDEVVTHDHHFEQAGYVRLLK